MTWVRKGWSSPEGYPAVYCDANPSVSGYLLPSGAVIDGSGRSLSCAGAVVDGRAPLPGTGGTPPATVTTELCWDGYYRTIGTCPPRPSGAAAPACPSLVPVGSHNPTNSPTRYVFLEGKLRAIPDPETAAAHGWTDWVDADPSCFLASLIGPPVPSVKGPGGAASGGAGAGASPVAAPGAGAVGGPIFGLSTTTVLLGGAALAGVLLLSGGRRR